MGRESEAGTGADKAEDGGWWVVGGMLVYVSVSVSVESDQR